jgi:hypothetical protein
MANNKLTIKQASQDFDISESAIKNRIQKKLLPSTKNSEGKHLVSVEDMQQFKEEYKPRKKMKNKTSDIQTTVNNISLACDNPTSSTLGEVKSQDPQVTQSLPDSHPDKISETISHKKSDHTNTASETSSSATDSLDTDDVKAKHRKKRSKHEKIKSSFTFASHLLKKVIWNSEYDIRQTIYWLEKLYLKKYPESYKRYCKDKLNKARKQNHRQKEMVIRIRQ